MDATAELRRDLARRIPDETLRRLTRKRPAAHFLVLAWQMLLLAGAGALAWTNPSWPGLLASVVLGFTVFNFTVMLHEAIHGLVFAAGRWPRAMRVLPHLYAFPSGLSASQFARWHLDHHAQLGDSELDPKRHRLSPKRNARWYKALYFTPALIPIYFRAARREAAGYPDALRARIARERSLTLAGHALILAALLAVGGAGVAARTYLLPMFVVFPVAFALNRLGQHYDVRPENPALWGTLMRASRFWNLVFLWSGHHLEHHYFPRVPFYNLPALRRALAPFFEEIGVRPSGYARLLRKWFMDNRPPHTDWRESPSEA